MYGAYYYGQPYFGQSPDYSIAPPSRPNCGGMWGTATFGQSYFGQHIQCPEPPPPTPDTRTWCGGIWGTATFGQMYWGGHIQCPEPLPPAPPLPSGGGGGIGSGGIAAVRRPVDRPFDLEDHLRWVDETNRIRATEEAEIKRMLAQDAIDEEDLKTIILAWLNTQ